MLEKVVSEVTFEIGQIDLLLETYADLLERARTGTLDLVEVAAAASVLHSFYNGLESIFLSIAKGIDADVPTGTQWHRDLLARMAGATLTRRPVLTDDLVRRLGDYLGFRHFYRHSYSFLLEWDKLEKLVTPLAETWEQAKGELVSFLDGLNPGDQNR